MCEPGPNDPQDTVVANQYMSDIKLFNQIAKHWVEEYANPERTLLKKVKELTDMGFSKQQAREALQKKIMKMQKKLLIIQLGLKYQKYNIFNIFITAIIIFIFYLFIDNTTFIKH